MSLFILFLHVLLSPKQRNNCIRFLKFLVLSRRSLHRLAKTCVRQMPILFYTFVDFFSLDADVIRLSFAEEVYCSRVA
jgi:hypothetical protein